jgi:methionine sulfoxide reductase heme-binding subunit
MPILKTIVNHPAFFWMVLYLPAVGMINALVDNRASAESLLHPSGEFSARFMVILMMLAPLTMLFPKVRFLKWLNHRRRPLGVAAFLYAIFHTVLYVIDMQTLAAMIDEFWALGIWTGWFALFIFVPLGITSNDYFMRLLRQNWKWLHRWVYAAAVLTLVHWIFVHNNFGPALVHFVPLLLLEIYRLYRNFLPTAISAKIHL